eukprot:superscaffoldBa00005544_g20476
MSVNSSSNSSNSFLHLSPEDCIKSKPSIFIFKAFYITGMLLTLPFIILVLFVGLQRWKKQRSISTAATSHSDFFTYNMVAMELIKFVGACFYWYGAYTDVHSVKRVGKSLYVLTSPGQTMFHILTCAERYLAVVHPITYMRLRQGGGVRIRNISSLRLPNVEMLFNSSSPSNSSLEYLLYHCSNSSVSFLISTVFNITRAVLLFPLSILVLYLGHQRWRQQQCSFAKISHSDIFTYHLLTMELIWFLGFLGFLCGSSVNLREMVIVGYGASSIAFYGEALFHLLTCVERYLAVVHPITYMGLRNARGVRVRNISIGCSRSRKGVLIFTAFSITNILLLLPLSILILYLGFRRWKLQRSVSTAATTSHSDIFTYNMVALELIGVLGSLLYCAGVYMYLPEVIVYGSNLFVIILAMKIQFHTLTCVERYLAVVHPITYLGLKNKSGIRIRNISIVRPGPGEVAGDKERVDQSKRRAFHTIMTIMVALLLGSGGMLVGNIMDGLLWLSYSVRQENYQAVKTTLNQDDGEQIIN